MNKPAVAIFLAASIGLWVGFAVGGGFESKPEAPIPPTGTYSADAKGAAFERDMAGRSNAPAPEIRFQKFPETAVSNWVEHALVRGERQEKYWVSKADPITTTSAVITSWGSGTTMTCSNSPPVPIWIVQ